MKLTKRLLRQYFGSDALILWWFFGYQVTTRTGGSVYVTEKRFEDIRGGADIWDAAIGLGGALWGQVYVTNTIENVAHAMLSGRKLGVPIEVRGRKHFFGLITDPPPALPSPSGAYGSQNLDWSAHSLRVAGLLGAGYGQGIRVGACWETGEPLRYAGDDAENSIIGFGPPGGGKGTCFQIVAGLEFMGSSFWIDPSGQLFMTIAPELMRRGVRVIPLMPFAEGFPPEVAALARQTRCLNPMDALMPGSESFDADRSELAQLLKPQEEGNGGDPFFSLSGRALINMLIGCVKLYEHPSDPNLPEVYHKLGNVFGYARSLMGRPGMPRTISTPLRRWAAPGAETDRTLRSIVETALAELSWLGDASIERLLRTSSFAWDDLKNSPCPVAVFVLLPVNKLESHKPLLTLCAGAALMGLSKSGRGRRRVLFTVDEAALLNYMPMLQRGFAESRKRGVTLSVWFQNYHQAEAIYGPAWKNMLSGSDLQVWLRPRDLASAEYISEQIGNYTEVIPHFSHSPARDNQGRELGSQESVSFSEQGRPVLFPQDVMALPNHPNGQGSAAILIAPGRSRNALKIWARPWFDCPDLRDKGGIDAYHQHRTKGAGK
jgi:type IV secretory pathway TraG/TraD family ATPase VirD4